MESSVARILEEGLGTLVAARPGCWRKRWLERATSTKPRSSREGIATSAEPARPSERSEGQGRAGQGIRRVPSTRYMQRQQYQQQ